MNYICAEYGKDKVVIMGHSWGTVPGGVYACNHPQKVSAYVGVGQLTDVWESEQYAAREAMRLANAAGETDDAEKIEEQFQLVRTNPTFNIQELLALRQHTGKHLPKGESPPISAILFSPYMTFNDLRWYLTPQFCFDTFAGAEEKLYAALYSEKGFSMYDYTQYEVPVVIIAGDSDWITPYSMAQDYFDTISAPKKEFVRIENAGHIPFIPGRFTDALQNALNDVL